MKVQTGQPQPCDVAPDLWRQLVRVVGGRVANCFVTAKAPGGLWLGAQETNAEAIPFEGRAEQNLLLHFWALTSLIFVPQAVNADGEGEFVGYVLAIPEVSDLENFLLDYPQMLGQLSRDVRGFRPAEAVIDLPAQGALSFLEHLARLSSQHAERQAIRYSVVSIDYLHLAKFGNNIKALAAGRLAPRPNLLDGYEAVVGRPGQPPPYRNPLFRRGLMLALLEEQAWYEPMAPMLMERPWPFFIRSEQSPRALPWFWQDAARYFEKESADYQRTLEARSYMNASAPTDKQTTPLELLILRLVQSYVNRKTEERSGLKWDDFKDNKVKDEQTGKERISIPEPYREAREKVASSAFLEMRSRREQAFVDHFTATFCSVKQFLREEEFQVVARALLHEPENVKTLTLLALSANS
jgi:CRISPR-associated protein Cmx8